MKSVGFTEDERSAIWKIVSAILHLVGTYFIRICLGHCSFSV